MWLARGICLALALYGLASAAASLVAPVLAGAVRHRAQRRSPGLTADLLFAVRLIPSALAILLAIALFIPAYAAFEPTGGGERVGLALPVLAGVSLIPLLAGLRRGLGAYRATQRLRGRWVRTGSAIRLAGWPAPAIRVAERFPVVAVIGVLRPRLFVAGQVLDRLDADEVRAMLAHETGHLDAGDNLKSLLVRGSMDWLGLLPVGRRLASEWRHAAELAADERGRRAGAGAALALASALVRVAQMAPAGSRLGLPASTLVNGAGVADRVDRLLRGETPARGRRAGLPPRLGIAAAALLAAAGAAVVTDLRALEAVYSLGEAVLRILG